MPRLHYRWGFLILKFIIMKQSLFLDLDKGTIEEVQKLTTLWKQFQPIVINNLSKEEEVRKQKENTVNYSQKDWDELMKRNKKATEETYKNWNPKQEKIFTLHDAENIFTDSRLTNPLVGFKYNTFLDYMQANYGDIPTTKTFSEPWDKL